MGKFLVINKKKSTLLYMLLYEIDYYVEQLQLNMFLILIVAQWLRSRCPEFINTVYVDNFKIKFKFADSMLFLKMIWNIIFFLNLVEWKLLSSLFTTIWDEISALIGPIVSNRQIFKLCQLSLRFYAKFNLLNR